jgi:hypothetical protein
LDANFFCVAERGGGGATSTRVVVVGFGFRVRVWASAASVVASDDAPGPGPGAAASKPSDARSSGRIGRVASSLRFGDAGGVSRGVAIGDASARRSSSVGRAAVSGASCSHESSSSDSCARSSDRDDGWMGGWGAGA